MVAKKTGKQVAKWDEELAKRSQIAAKMEENSLGMGNSIGTQGGVLKYRDNVIPGNKINVIVLDHTFHNAYYTDTFDPENPSNPVCFAITKTEAALAPHEKSEEPQNKTCKGCPMNEWGTADRGKGKACANGRRLVLITEDALDNIEDAPVATIKVPVTSVKGWAGYVKQLADVLKRPPLAVVTEISLVPDKKHQFEMHFKMVREHEISAEQIGAIIAKADAKATQDVLMAPYLPFDREEKQAKPSRTSKTRAGAKARR